MPYAIAKISIRIQAYTLSIAPAAPQMPGAYSEHAAGACVLTLSESPCDGGPLLYVPDPAPGQVSIQAQEQTAYDVWLNWETSPVPRILVGNAGEALSLKCQGNQAYAILNWRNYVGTTKLTVVQGDTKIALPLEVRARKLGYLDDYRDMLDAISEQLAALVFHYDSPTSVYTQRAAKVAYMLDQLKKEGFASFA